MIENPGTGNIRNLLTFVKPSGRAVSLKAGTIVKAQVIDIADNGNAVLRLTATGNNQGTVIKAYSEVPLTKGQNIYLEILGGKNNITMKFIGNFKSPSEALQQAIPAKFLNMLAQLSSARASNAEFQQLFNMLKSLPQNIKATIPEFANIEKLLLDIKQLDGKLLKAFVETSGVAFETRLKIAAMSDPGSVLQNLIALQAEGDLKALLLRLKRLLKERGIINSLKAAGFRISDISATAEKFIKNIEFFQLTSRINDMFYTFLPFVWDELRDCEFLFRQNRDSRRKSYTCDINLDLESIGRLSISVTILDKAFYITFLTERHEIENLLRTHKHLLEKRFSSQGLPLKAININRKKEIAFGHTQRQGVNIKT